MTNQVLTWLIAHRQIDINVAKATDDNKGKMI